MSLFGQLLFILLFSLGPENGLAGQNVLYKAKNVECSTNPDFLVNCSCSVVAVSWYKAYINADSDIVQPIKNVSVRTNFYKKDDNNQFKPFLFSFTFNVCKSDEKKYHLIPYSQLVVRHIRTYTNLNHSCPYIGHMMVRNLQLEDEAVPDFLVGEYKLSFRFFENSIQIGQMHFVVEALERRKVKPKFNV